jgi:hypothetical protein
MIGAITAGLFSTGAAPVSPTAYESIATVNVGVGGSALVSFTGIPSTYKHLQIRYAAANNSASFQQMQFNADTGTNYTSHYMYGNGSATGAGRSTTTTAMEFGDLPNSSTTFGVGVIDILDYQNTNKNKTTRFLAGKDLNGSGVVVFTSGLWLNSSSAVSSISLLPLTLYSQYSSFALYGIKG